MRSPSLTWLWFLPLASFTAPLRADPNLYETSVAPFLAKHCAPCHNPEKKKGDLVLGPYANAAAAAGDRAAWQKVAEKLKAREMPPKGRPQPSAAEVEAVLKWIDDAVFRRGAGGKRDPGRVTIRRLNIYEYNYTIRDLFGLDLKPADDFPADEVGYGFDNIGDVLSIPPLLLERYIGAAEKVMAKAIIVDGKKGAELPESHKRILFLAPKGKADRRECTRKVLERFASRAYRRPATSDEVNRLLKLTDLAEKNGDSFERGIQVACQALLVSPHFLFRVELDSEPRNPAAAHPVTDYELASRLSYFLWSSMPDEELFELARKGVLRQEETLEPQVKRMLADQKSRGLLKTFSALWLGGRQMKLVSPDTARFPAFDEDLRSAMRRETELFFEEVIKKDLSVLVFLESDFTFLNEKLARHYGFKGVKGPDFRRVELKDVDERDERGTIVTQGTILTVTSNPTRTSPVKRGKWILEQLLGAPPPPPPPGNDNLKEDGGVALSGTLRQRTEQHRKNPDCANCHAKMDPLGFALENYDAVGAWREKDGDLKIDASASLPDGVSFDGVKGLKKVLLERKEDFCRCLCEKMLTFALGRGLEYTDKYAIDSIARELKEHEYRFSSLVLAIVKSEPFQMRRGEKVMP
jgi:hypothetical protein